MSESVFGPYFDGEAEVYGDPTELFRELQKHSSGQLAKLVDQSREEGPQDSEGDSLDVLEQKASARQSADSRAFPAIERLQLACRAAFKMKPFDRMSGKGATERQVNKVMNDFFRYLSDEKKSTGDSPTK